jgi:hypothetical protein
MVLLLALLYTSNSSSISPQTVTANMEAVAAKAESAHATAKEIENKVEMVDAQLANMETSIARVEATVAAAQTVVTPAPPTITPTPAPTKPMIPVEVGVGITYQATSGPGMVLFPVDSLKVYRSYADFEADWPPNEPVTVRLALIETQGGSGEWQLFIAADEPTVDTGAMSTGWSEYALLVERAKTEEGETAGEPSLTVENLVFAEGPKQKIVDSMPFERGETTFGSLLNLADTGANPNLSRNLLLADESTRVTKYILIIFDPASGLPGDQCKVHCSTCQGVSCWICWLCG